MLISIMHHGGSLDRLGCGDELYLDAQLKAQAWLAELEHSLLELGLEPDLIEEPGDDLAAH